MNTSGPLSALSVLVVEDEFLIAVEAQRIVEEAGAGSVILVNSIEAARTALDLGPVDVCVLDVQLGRDHGAVLTHDLISRGIPFVVASGLRMDADIAGINPALVLAKPYRDVELIEALRTALDRAAPGRPA